eukprot:6178185-Pleurochrysis_carterae.AAC.2
MERARQRTQTVPSNVRRPTHARTHSHGHDDDHACVQRLPAPLSHDHTQLMWLVLTHEHSCSPASFTALTLGLPRFNLTRRRCVLQVGMPNSFERFVAQRVRARPRARSPSHSPTETRRATEAVRGSAFLPGVRLMPPFGWVGVLPSASAGWLGSFSAEAPDAPPLSALQGGWMLTRAQLERARALCPGGFLPPAGADATGAPWLPRYSVDFWSGAQLFSWKHCGFARIALLSTPRDVASQLVMHATANKQLQVPHKVHRVVHTLESLWRLVQLANASAAQPHAPSDAADAQLPREQRTEGCATEHCRREQAGSEQPWKRRGRRALAV